MIPLNYNFGLSISCASNPRNPRNFDDGLWEAGAPVAWYENRLEPLILASDAGTIFVRNPGGMDAGADLLFDQLTNCQMAAFSASDPAIATKLRAMGEASEWAYVCGQIRNVGRRVALYLGAVKKWNGLSVQQLVYLAHRELDPFIGAIDELYIDCGNEAKEHDAYPIVSEIAHDLGIVCGAENRPLTGNYSHLMNHPHCVKGTYWDTTGGRAGRDEFAPILPGMVCTVLSDERDSLATNATRYLREAGRVSASIWDGIKASDIIGSVVE